MYKGSHWHAIKELLKILWSYFVIVVSQSHRNEKCICVLNLCGPSVSIATEIIIGLITQNHCFVEILNSCNL